VRKQRQVFAAVIREKTGYKFPCDWVAPVYTKYFEGPPTL